MPLTNKPDTAALSSCISGESRCAWQLAGVWQEMRSYLLQLPTSCALPVPPQPHFCEHRRTQVILQRLLKSALMLEKQRNKDIQRVLVEAAKLKTMWRSCDV